MSRSGQPPKPLDGDTPQANELAAWLRKLTYPLTVRQLEERFTFGRSQWSEFRRGRKLIPSYLLEELVNDLVREPRLRETTRAEGRRRLAAAEQAAMGKAQLPPPKDRGPALELHIRLDDARKGQLQAQETVMFMSQLIFRLLGLMAELNKQCRILEEQRDRATDKARTEVLAEIGQHLVELKQRNRQADERVARARRKREEAEQIRVAAQQLAEQYRRALEAFQQRTTDGEPEPPDAEPESSPVVPLYEYDVLLEHADDELAAHAQELSQLREQIGLDHPNDTDPDPGPKIVRGEIVDSADKPMNSSNAADSGKGAVSADTPDKPDQPSDHLRQTGVVLDTREDAQAYHASGRALPRANPDNPSTSAIRDDGSGVPEALVHSDSPRLLVGATGEHRSHSSRGPAHRTAPAGPAAHRDGAGGPVPGLSRPWSHRRLSRPSARSIAMATLVALSAGSALLFGVPWLEKSSGLPDRSRPTQHAPIGGDDRPAQARSQTTLYAWGDGTLHALDADTGKEHWTHPTVRHEDGNPDLGSADGNLYVSVGPDERYRWGVDVLDAVTGKKRWDHLTEFGQPTGTHANGMLYVIDDEVPGRTDEVPDPPPIGGEEMAGIPAGLTALDATTGKERWSYPTGEFDATPVSDGKNIYSGGAFALFALDADTGEKRWSYEGWVHSLAADDGMIYASYNNWWSNGLELVALDAESGTKRWSYPRTAEADDPVVTGGTVFLNDASLTALDGKTGNKRWTYPKKLTTSPMVAGGTVYALSNGEVVALDEDTGKKRWSYPTRDAAHAVVLDGTVYVSGTDVVALDAKTGAKRWSHGLGDSASTPIVTDTVVYVGSSNGVTALDAESGKERWTFPCDTPELLTTAVP
ncbi:outer membrane protein assembly factor BamB [Streptomyces umbrinus]|uniref:Outer membrane protein assembly factor BamB n=1 Tax=Streptomyces umbrinus TaxID=67370 RepID=A0ABU0SMC9_9ACTN|nr:PQQ-binding-like beta-propeller repeat protein [Streptomyces umbrinus]MDQ1024704.1 outer membrane protein assembly factor BamB [Streptomyces umbrinus]